MKSPTHPPPGDTATEPVRDAPAFDFYPERWLVGVAGMSDAEQLSYLRLLCHQWLLGDAGLPPDPPALRRLGGKGVTPAVLAKLPLKADGRRRNARLEKIREEQRERIAKKSEQRRAAANKRWHPATGSPPAPDLPPAPASSRATPLGPQAGSPRRHPGAVPSHSVSTCETAAADMRPHCGSSCETAAAGMPTTHHPPPTSHPVPEDTNNAGAGGAESAADPAAAAPAADTPLADAARQQPAAASEDAAAHAATAQEAAAEQAAADAAAAAERAASARRAAVTAEATPGLTTVLAWAGAIGCPPDKAEIWWHEHEARPLSAFGCWTDRDGNAVRRPQHALAAWWQKWQANDHQRSTRTHPPSTTSYHATSRPAAVRSDNANAPGRYA